MGCSYTLSCHKKVNEEFSELTNTHDVTKINEITEPKSCH